LTKGTSKNDAALEQYLQQAMVKIKNLEGQNKDLKEELSRAKDAMGKTANKWGK
jgi:predicted  nucleic acid-binding Zn-ribbon protein